MTDAPKPYLYLGVFLTSLSAIVFEVTLTRIFSVTLWYHFAYFVVSMAQSGRAVSRGVSASWISICASQAFWSL